MAISIQVSVTNKVTMTIPGGALSPVLEMAP